LEPDINKEKSAIIRWTDLSTVDIPEDIVQTKGRQLDIILDRSYYIVRPDVWPVLREAVRIDIPVRQAIGTYIRDLIYIAL